MEQRRRQAAESLLTHSLFGFQVHDVTVSKRLQELKELLVATCNETDQIALLSENIREIEDQLTTHREQFLLEPLRRFEQDMELLLDVGSGDDEFMTGKEEDSLLLTDGDDCLSFSQESRVLTTSHPSTPRNTYSLPKKATLEEDEVLCGVCFASDSLENDPIVICEICGVAVHQTCYRLGALPDGDWYCHPCRQYLTTQDIEKNLIPTHELECVACYIKAGAMIPTVDEEWVHVACSMFLPELYLQEKYASRFHGRLDELQVVCGVEKLKRRRRLRCCFCKKTNGKGACAQCAVGKCVVAYHALCALQNGIKLRYMEDKGQFGSGCLKHQDIFLNNNLDVESKKRLSGKSFSPLSNKVERSTTPKQSPTNSSSDENESANDDAIDNDGTCSELDMDNRDDGNQIPSSSKGNRYRKYVKEKSLTTSDTTLSRGSPSLKKDGTHSNKLKPNRQIKLAFVSTVNSPVRSRSKPKTASNTRPYSSISAPQNATFAVDTHQTLASTTRQNINCTSRVVLESNVFTPSFYPRSFESNPDDQDFEYVMVLITSRPLGLGIASSKEAAGIFLFAQNTRNSAILEALKRGVLCNGDEVFALNDVILRNTDLESFKNEIVPQVSLPVRCWFRTLRKHRLPIDSCQDFSLDGTPQPNDPGTLMLKKVKPFSRKATPAEPSRPASANANASNSSKASHEGDYKSAHGEIEWPWSLLRSDGKLAMNLFWISLDSSYFLRKITKRTFTELQEKVEAICGVPLEHSHPDYAQVRELLMMPRRERLPAYIVEFRERLEQKQQNVSVGIPADVSEDEKSHLDEESALQVGTTVSVAKRTWPGMNKLGGVGRIKKVKEKALPDGRKQFTYDIAYVLSGSERNVERKYISVVDLDAEKSKKNGENNFTTTERRQKGDSDPIVNDMEEEDASTLSTRLIVGITRTGSEEMVAILPDVAMESSLKQRRFQLQFSTKDSTVYCERKTDRLDPARNTKELLLHRHFQVKRCEDDALINTCFVFELLSIEDLVGDEVDEDDTDSNDEGNEIKSQLASLQLQFRSVVEANEVMFTRLKEKVELEYALKKYRQDNLQAIQWRNYERMYQELETAKRQFDESDENSDSGVEMKAESEGDSSDSEDVSFGGMFVNKLKQEGSQVCALCELSGGDFAATDTGRLAHPQCALFTPETFFKDGVVHGINLVDPQRQRLKCSICGGRKGVSKVQCAHRKCARAYHVACAFVNGLLTRDPYYQAWCPRHLKTSGMARFVNLPDHMNEEENAFQTAPSSPPAASSPARRPRKYKLPSSRRMKKTRVHQDTTPCVKASTVRKRKRKESDASDTGTSVGSFGGTRGNSPSRNLLIESEEARCGRQLEVDELKDDSDDESKAVEAWQRGRDLNRIFQKNDAVEVLARDWRGINKPGGVARVRAVEVVPNAMGGRDVFYDVVHIVGAFREKHLPAKFVRDYRIAT